MTITTQESLTGFIATDPQLTFTSAGVSRFSARIGQDHVHRNTDGSFTQEATTFHTLVLYRRAAERAYDQFARGDHFIADGTVNRYEFERDGETITGEEFVARHIGHDTTRTRYTVDRTHRTAAPRIAPPGPAPAIPRIDGATVPAPRPARPVAR